MKWIGLIRKDVYELIAQARVLLALTAIYLLAPLFTDGAKILGGVAILLLAMLPISALGYDERCKWNRYALAMPLKKQDLFWSKFLLGVIALLLGGLIQLAAALIAGRGEIVRSLPLTMLTALCYLAVTLPLMFKLGVEKGRLLLMLLTAGFLILGGTLLP